MASGVYQILNTVTNKRYIGSSSDNVRGRWSDHRLLLKSGKHHSRSLQRSWNKHGGDAFEFRVLLHCAPKDAIFYEQLCLDAYDSCKSGYNMRPHAGSNLGMPRGPISAWHRSRLLASSLGKKRGPMPEETRAKISKANRGKKLAPRSVEYRAKLSAALTGRKMGPRSAEARANQSKAQMGKKMPPFSAEHRAKLRAANLGKKKSPHSVETRAKMSASQLGKKRGPLSAQSLEARRKRMIERGTEAQRREKLAKSHLGKKRGPYSAEHRANISKALRARIRRSGIVTD